MLCTERDITLRKVMEESLREKEQNYHLLVENADAAIARITTGGVFVLMNHRAAAMLGGKPEDFVGKTMWDVFPPDVAESQMKNVQRVIETRAGFIGEARTVVRGDPRWFSDNVQPIFDPDGTVSSVQLIAIDVTERWQAEQSLRESEKRYRRLISTAQEGVWIIDSKDRAEYVNQRMAEMLGYAPEEIQGRPMFDFIDESDQPRAAERLAQRRRGIAEHYDFRFRRKDGSYVWVMISGTPILDDVGRYLGSLAMISDVNERRRSWKKPSRRRSSSIA